MALSSYRFREGVSPVRELCFIARDNEDILCGAIRNWPVKVGLHIATLRSSIAVHPVRQGEGFWGSVDS